MKSLLARFTICLAAFACATPTSKMDIVVADLLSLETTMRLYIAQFGEPPESWADLVDGEFPFLHRVPTDPWGNEYYLEQDAESNQLTIGSYGRDNQPGGEGTNMDTETEVRVPSTGSGDGR